MALDDDTLQRYYDGELAPDEAHKIRAEVAESGAAQQRLRELARLTELMRAPALAAARELDADALFAGIEADIRKAKALGFGERFRLVSSEWLEHRRGVLVPALGSIAVAAAALLVLLVPRKADQPRAGVSGSDQLAVAALVHGSNIENVDFGQSTGTVFEVDNEGVSAAVVWISDEDEETP